MYRGGVESERLQEVSNERSLIRIILIEDLCNPIRGRGIVSNRSVAQHILAPEDTASLVPPFIKKSSFNLNASAMQSHRNFFRLPYLVMSIRLVSHALVIAVWGQRHLVTMIVSTDNIRARHRLVIAAGLLHLQSSSSCVVSISLALGLGVPQSPFVTLVVRVAASGTTADGEEPEQSCPPREGYGQPTRHQRVVAQVQFDVVVFEDFVERTDEDGEQNGGGQDCGDCEEGADEGEDPRDETAPAGEEGEYADHDGYQSRPKTVLGHVSIRG